MFTGFASENTPAIQVWEASVAAASAFAISSVSLADDCAPIQFFKTGGGQATGARVYLPSAPIEGKQIKIINAKYGTNNITISIHASDVSGGGTSNSIATLGAGQTLDFCYSKNFISFGTSAGSRATGWITLNQSPAGAINNQALISGGTNNQASGINAFVGGGSFCAATGSQSFVSGGSSNTASGANSFVTGNGNTASGSNSFVGGGSTGSASGNQSFVLGGSSSSASGVFSAAIGGSTNIANADVATVIGGYYGTARSIIGNTVFPANGLPIASVAGVTQSGLLLLGVATTDATATRLRCNTSAATTTNQVILPNNSAYVFQGTCIANVTGGSTTSGWKYEGVIKRGANAASTTLVAAVTPTVIAQDVAAATWVLAITADTTNGGIAVTVTGAAATTIRWVSRIETTEVTF
jgi:hypothetical protein